MFYIMSYNYSCYRMPFARLILCNTASCFTSCKVTRFMQSTFYPSLSSFHKLITIYYEIFIMFCNSRGQRSQTTALHGIRLRGLVSPMSSRYLAARIFLIFQLLIVSDCIRYRLYYSNCQIDTKLS